MEVVQYKCPNCSASLEFDEVTQRFHCGYCYSSFTSEDIVRLFVHNEQHPLDIADPKPTEEDKMLEEFGGANNLYSCPGCGAAIITDELTAATCCYYCHTPAVLTGRLSGKYKPDFVIPFKVSREQALEQFRLWCGTKRLVPKDFKSLENAEKIEGIYIPYWLASCCAAFSLNITAKIIKSNRVGDYRISNIKEYSLERDGSFVFSGVPADGSSKASDLLMENIEPYDYSEMVGFSMSYLTGHPAEKYDVTHDMVQAEIEKRVKEAGKAEILKGIEGYSTTTVSSEACSISNLNWQYALLPVWFLSYRYKDTDYHFAMNGQTGKFAGNLPLRKGLLLWCILGVLSVPLIILLLGGLLLLC